MSTTNVCHLVKLSFIKKRKISPLCCAYSEDKKKTSHSKDVFATRKCKNVKTDIIHKELFCTKIFVFSISKHPSDVIIDIFMKVQS